MRILLMAMVISLGGCSWFQKASVQAVLTSVESAGCVAETAVLTNFSTKIAAQLNCTHPDAIQASLTAALGNVNLCKLVPAHGIVSPTGVVGNIVCPIAVSTAIGFMTSAIPTAWGCTVTQEAGAVSAVLTSICESSVPL
mgnify:CR=1 FL=1